MSPSGRLASGVTRGDLRAEILTFDDVTVGYGGAPVLEEITFNVRRGEVAGVVALDGRGRSTLVKCAAGLLQPTKGTVNYETRDVYGMTFGEDQKFRARSAVVFEGGALLANRTIFENVALPLRYHLAMADDDLETFVGRLLQKVGYAENPNVLPWQVSARGRKLAALARALVREPELVLVDRFFENLEAHDQKRLMELVLELNVKNGTSFLLVGELTPMIFQVAERVLVLEGGRILAHGFKRALFKIEKIKKAFEEGEAEASHAAKERETAAEDAGIPAAMQSQIMNVPALETESHGFDATSDSDSQPIVVLEGPPAVPNTPPAERRRETMVKRRALAPADLGSPGGDDASEATITLDASAADALLAQAKARAAERVEEEARALEGAAPPGADPKTEDTGSSAGSAPTDAEEK